MLAIHQAAQQGTVSDESCTEIEPTALFADRVSGFLESDPFATTDATMQDENLDAQNATGLSLPEYYASWGCLNLYQDYRKPTAALSFNASGQQSNVFLGLPLKEDAKHKARLNNTGMDRCDRNNLDISSHRFHNGREFMVDGEYKKMKEDFTKTTWSKLHTVRDNVNIETGLSMPNNTIRNEARDVWNLGGIGLSFAKIKHQYVVTGRLINGPAASVCGPNTKEPLIKDGDILKAVDFGEVNGNMDAFTLNTRLVGLKDSIVYLEFDRIEHGVGFEIKYGPLVLDAQDDCDPDENEGERWDATSPNIAYVYYVTNNICFKAQDKDYRVEFGDILDAINDTKCSSLNPNEIQDMLHGAVNSSVKIDLWDRLGTTKRSMTVKRLDNHTTTKTYNVVLKRQQYEDVGSLIYHCADCVGKMRSWMHRPDHQPPQKKHLVLDFDQRYFTSLSSALPIAKQTTVLLRRF